MRIKALEEMREKLERDTSRTKAYPSAPIQHAFADGVTIEGYKALADKIEAEISERFMEIPCDKDGIPIRIGDTVNVNKWYAPRKVEGYTIVCKTRNGYRAWHDACDLRHVEPLTVEDVLADFAADVENDRNTPETAKRYADEIRSILGGGR